MSRLDCKIIKYQHCSQNGESIKNHILPNSLKVLRCYFNDLSCLPNLPNSLEELYCAANKLTIFPKMSNSLKKLNCDYNPLVSFDNSQIPNSLEELSCYGNQLISVPDISHIDHDFYLCLNQNLPINYFHIILI